MSQREPAERSGDSNGLAKLLILAVFVAVGAAVWLLTRTPETAGVPSTRPTTATTVPVDLTRPVVGVVFATTMTADGPKRTGGVIDEIRYLGKERTQTGPDTFSTVRVLQHSDGRIERERAVDVKVVAAPPRVWPPANADATAVDLLAGLDVDAATVAGTWRRGDGDAVSSDLGQATRIDLCYRPPAEYDLRFTFTRLQGNDGLDTILYAGGRRFYWTFAGWENTVSGFGTVLGQTADDNPTTRKREAWLTNDVQYKADVRVRRDGVQVRLNGELVGDLRTDYRDVNLVVRRMHRPDSVGFSTWESGYEIKDVRLIEVAGHGTRLDPPRATVLPATRPATLPAAAVAQPPAVAAVDFAVAGRPPAIYYLYADGSVTGMDEYGDWAVAGDQIAFRWRNFVDTCTLSPDRKSFSGHNQVGDSIQGVLRAGTL